MAEILFKCSSCNVQLAASDEEAGDSFECPKCKAVQRVPAAQKKPTTGSSAAGAPVVKIPKKTIILPPASRDDEDDSRDVEVLGPIGGSGLRMFAVALGTVGFLLCGLSVVWALFVLHKNEANWWLLLLVFVSTFLCGLMGLVVAQMARFIVRVGERIDLLEVD